MEEDNWRNRRCRSWYRLQDKRDRLMMSARVRKVPIGAWMRRFNGKHPPPAPSPEGEQR